MICFRRSWSSVDVSFSKSFRNVDAESDKSWKEDIVEFRAVIFSSKL